METGTQVDAVQRYRALLAISDEIAHHRDLNVLLHELSGRLHDAVEFDFINVILCDLTRNAAKLYVGASDIPAKIQPGFELPLQDTPADEVMRTQRPLVIDDVEAEHRYPPTMALARDHGVRSFCALPLSTARRQLGILVFGSTCAHAYADADLDFLFRVASQVALAIDNAMNYEALAAARAQLQQERDRLHLLLELSRATLSKLDFRELFSELSQRHREVRPEHDFAAVTLYDRERKQLRVRALDFPAGKMLDNVGAYISIEGTPAGHVYKTGKPLCMCPLDAERFPAEITRQLIAEGIQSACWVPLETRNGILGTMSVGRFAAIPYRPEDINYLVQIATHVAIASENAMVFREVSELRDRLAEEKLYLEDEIRTEFNFDEIVGESAPLKRILKQVEIVAPTDSTVMLLGETGTGKELLARAIHRLSPRSQRTFVKVNCAAIPAGLLESELFGHEKGAFTGAIVQKLGRIELADKGTLFLDEVGDIPLELQPKLLRALQEHEFERLGSNATRKVDVRVVAATNRDLSRMVAEGEFRADLYYRLYVFPINVPPLRDRQDDIPVLVSFFVKKYARRMNRKIDTIPAETMQALRRAPWPGNIRELENFIERAVILSTGPVLRVPLQQLKQTGKGKNAITAASNGMTLHQAERDHILAVLRECRGVIAGANGAAAKLGLKRTTLLSKMKKLEISRDDM